MTRLHYAFSRAVPRYGHPPSGALRLFSIAAHHIPIASHPGEAFYDIIALDREETIYALPFVRRDGAEYVFHQHSAGLGEKALREIRETLERKCKHVDKAPIPFREQFASDELLDSIRTDPLVAGMAVLPGISQPGAVELQLDRYAFAAPRVAGGDVLDLRSGSGFGLWHIARIARSVQSRHENAYAKELALRLKWPWVSDAREFDAVLALGIQSHELDEILDQGRALHRSAGKTIVSVRGEQGRAALERAGLEPIQLSIPAAVGAYEEWIAVEQPAARRAPPKAVSPAEPASPAPRPLSIVFLLRSTAQTIFGGDIVQVTKTAEALRMRGHRVDIKLEPDPDVAGYDIVNLTGITSVGETLAQAAAVKDFPGPIVLMSIFTDHADETVWGMRVAPVPFAFEKTSDSLAQQLELLSRREITAEGHPAPPVRTELHQHYTAAQVAILGITDHIIANAYSEVFRIKKYLSPDVPFSLAPSCVDFELYGITQRERFFEKYGLKDFVLLPGRFEMRKNHLLFFEAVRRMDGQFLCIGRNDKSWTGDLLRAYWPDNVLILPEMPESEFAGAVAAASAVVIPSWDEVVTLTSLNAALSQTPLVLSRNSYEHEYFGDDAEYCDPADPASIRAAIERALEGYDRRRSRRAQLAARIRSECNWGVAAAATEAAYYKLLTRNPRGVARLARVSKEVR